MNMPPLVKLSMPRSLNSARACATSTLLHDPRHRQSLGPRGPHINHFAEKPFRVRFQSAVAHTLTLLAGKKRDDIRVPSVDGEPPPDGAIGRTEHSGNFLYRTSQSPRMFGQSLNCIEPPARQMPIAIRDCHQVRDRPGGELALDH